MREDTDQLSGNSGTSGASGAPGQPLWELAVSRLNAEFGDAEKPADHRWSIERGLGYPPVHIAIDDWGSHEIAKVWIFDPHSNTAEGISVIEIVREQQIDELVERIRSRLQA